MTNKITDQYYTPFNIDLEEISKDRFRWNKFKDKVTALPENFKEVLSSVQTAEFFINLFNKYSLTEEGFKNLLRITRDIILADLYLGDIIKEIESKVGVEENIAKEIANSIISNLFSLIIEDLKKIHIQKFRQGLSQVGSQQFPTSQSKLPQVKLEGNTINLRSQE